MHYRTSQKFYEEFEKDNSILKKVNSHQLQEYKTLYKKLFDEDMQEYIHDSSTDNNAIVKKIMLEAKESLINKNKEMVK